MNEQMYIVFKKNDNGSYSFYNIFVTPVGNQVQLEDDHSKGISMCTGIVSSAKDSVLENIFGNDSDSVTFSSVILSDDGHDDYFSILIDNNQLNKYVPKFQLGDEITEEGILTFLEELYRKCDGIQSLKIERGEKNVVLSEVEFSPDRDNVELRDRKYLRNILSLPSLQKIYDENMRMAREIGESLGVFIHELDSDDSSDVFDYSDIDVEEIIAEIKSRVIGQDVAVETIVNNIYNNQIIIDSGNEDFILSSLTNMIFDGPSGTGKSLIVQQVAKRLSLPMVFRPVITFSTVGYKGADLTELLTELLDKADGNLELAERGIIALDEFDKLASNDGGLEIKRAVQQELLGYIGAGKQPIEYKGKKISFDMSRITFVGIGAFTKLRERKIKESASKKIGFTAGSVSGDKTYTITMQDFIDEGLHKELVARFALPVHTDHLTHEKLVEILKTSKISPAKWLIENGKLYGVDIIFSDDIMDKIADYALEIGTEARALKEILTSLKNILLPKMISSRIDRIVIDEELLKKSREYVVRGY